MVFTDHLQCTDSHLWNVLGHSKGYPQSILMMHDEHNLNMTQMVEVCNGHSPHPAFSSMLMPSLRVNELRYAEWKHNSILDALESCL